MIDDLTLRRSWDDVFLDMKVRACVRACVRLCMRVRLLVRPRVEARPVGIADRLPASLLDLDAYSQVSLHRLSVKWTK